MGNLTAYHAKYLAHELTLRHAGDGVATIAGALGDARVDLNPHQVEAALFAFRSPLAGGAILADEVGLGKTIEAGLVISQRWAERRRRLLIITPANLRKQWSQELVDKFFLPSVILEKKSFHASVATGNLNPFEQDAVVLCSYQFAARSAPYLKKTAWDLVVIDEAHRLRNVYKPTARTANALKDALAPFRKILLTATPLQNSLVELYGLVSFVDEHTFGDLKSFKKQFGGDLAQKQALSMILAEPGDPAPGPIDDLKARLAPLCHRTLRRQVREYVSYTNRVPITQEFSPSDDEHRLYQLVSDYLAEDDLHALPSSQRKLMTMILRKLLASSTFAIGHTLDGIAGRLEEKIRASAVAEEPAGGTRPGDLSRLVATEYEGLDETADEWGDDREGDDDSDDDAPADARLSPAEREAATRETARLREFAALAKSILRNAKGENLLAALRKGLTETLNRGGAEKALIFTESTRTQEYIRQLLELSEYKGRIVLFNGTNNDPESKAIYSRWLEKHAGSDRITGSPTADKRAALTEYFRDEAAIMIATEAAAEGVNLQFCSLIVNYDLPWNPQRVEQRIGRCHRYGQKCDVVIVNFINLKNAADRRVYDLLAEKFKLFDGVFGASDQVLGAIENGVDIEKRIADIYQSCRTPRQIEFNFNELQKSLEDQIRDRMDDTRRLLLENFDESVQEKLRFNKIAAGEQLDRRTRQLQALTRHALGSRADWASDGLAFSLGAPPYADARDILAGRYRFVAADKAVSDADAHPYRVHHPLAERLIADAKAAPTPAAELTFRLADRQVADLAPLRGRSGLLTVSLAAITALDTEEHLLVAGLTDAGDALPAETCRRLFTLDAASAPAPAPQLTAPPALRAALAAERTRVSAEVDRRNGDYFEAEMRKLDRWAEDQRLSLKSSLEDIEAELKTLERTIATAGTLPEKIRLQGDRKKLESRRDDAWRAYDLARRDIGAKKDLLLETAAARLTQSTVEIPLFTLRWSVV